MTVSIYLEFTSYGNKIFTTPSNLLIIKILMAINDYLNPLAKIYTSLLLGLEAFGFLMTTFEKDFCTS